MTQLTNITLDEIIYRGQIGELSPLSQEDWDYIEKLVDLEKQLSYDEGQDEAWEEVDDEEDNSI